MNEETYLKETDLLDFNHPALVALLRYRKWGELGEYDKIGAIYSFVKDEIAFGYNESDDIPASRILRAGYGQCNTKSTLLMALLRSVGVPCRTHAFAIDKRVQRGAVPALVYKLAPDRLLHTWAEVRFTGDWLALEGCILDRAYLDRLQSMCAPTSGVFCGYAAAVQDLHHAPVQWMGKDTYIQKEAIAEDYGIFDSPDEVYRSLGSNLHTNVFRRLIFCHIVRRLMNRRVARLRTGIARESITKAFTVAKAARK